MAPPAGSGARPRRSSASTPAKVCVCELLPLFDISQPTLSHHLKKLRDAGVIDSERQGLWAYYYVKPQALDELADWRH
jgi:ArsR family transcriptional regulator